jgi:hypothetical protein
MIKNMDLELLLKHLEKNILDIGKTVNNMVKEK